MDIGNWLTIISVILLLILLVLILIALKVVLGGKVIGYRWEATIFGRSATSVMSHQQKFYSPYKITFADSETAEADFNNARLNGAIANWVNSLDLDPTSLHIEMKIKKIKA